MDTFKNPSTPPAAKALSLVRLHHAPSSPTPQTVPVLAGMEKNASHRAWNKSARLNHLRAKRRQRGLREIPEAALPVILEIDGGKNFVVLKERVDSSDYVVQFPDSREAPVSIERLEESYSGFCIFLSPVNENSGGGFFRNLFTFLKA